MKKENVINDVIKLWAYLGRKRQVQFVLLFFLMLISVVAEMVSIGAVIPFLTVLTSPGLLMDLDWFQPIIRLLDIQEADDLLLPMTMLFIVSVFISGSLRILLLWVTTKLSASMGIQLRSDVYEQTLYQSYESHAEKNSSELISLATEKVGAAIQSGILHVLMMMSALMMSVAIIATLLLINVSVAISAFVILGGGYLVVGYLVKGRIKNNGHIVAKNQPQAVKCMQEGLGGIRDVVIGSHQKVFCRKYKQAATNILQALMQNNFIAGLPKLLVEILSMTLIVVLAYWLQKNSMGQESVLPMLGAFALGAQRLLPSLQQVYFSWTQVNGSQAILSDVVTQLYSSNSLNVVNSNNNEAVLSPMSFNNSIVLDELWFRYRGSEAYVLKNIGLKISKGDRIGVIGATGSGKSTLLDIVMGLLSPTKGQLLIDGVAVNENNVRAWQANIAHVPQSIFLTDASIAENIAFGIPLNEIDYSQVALSAKQAQVSEFIDGLPESYQTLVGERGVRLSGGQRQRIGIARALYKQASIIVFDEATSALDSETESEVIKAIDNLSKELTIIVIAHRLSTLESCGSVIEVSQGEVLMHRSYRVMNEN